MVGNKKKKLCSSEDSYHGSKYKTLVFLLQKDKNIS